MCMMSENNAFLQCVGRQCASAYCEGAQPSILPPKIHSFAGSSPPPCARAAAGKEGAMEGGKVGGWEERAKRGRGDTCVRVHVCAVCMYICQTPVSTDLAACRALTKVPLEANTIRLILIFIVGFKLRRQLQI